VTAALIDTGELEALEREVARAFAGGDHAHLHVLGYGEISSVLAWETAAGPVAVKRLPPFPDLERYRAYAAAVTDYLVALAARGIPPVTTELASLERDGGGAIAYIVQPILDPAALGPTLLGGAGEADAARLFEQILDRILGFVDPAHGLDGQLSNWAVVDGALCYLDVSTPMLRDPDGRDRLDPRVFMASLPWALRPLVSRFMLRGILDKYFDPRGVVLDFLGNLHKERLEHLLPGFLAIAAARVTPEITATETERYYRGDARTWALLQRLRRLDRGWQRHVRRRPYPFLLPGKIER